MSETQEKKHTLDDVVDLGCCCGDICTPFYCSNRIPEEDVEKYIGWYLVHVEDLNDIPCDHLNNYYIVPPEVLDEFIEKIKDELCAKVGPKCREWMEKEFRECKESCDEDEAYKKTMEERCKEECGENEYCFEECMKREYEDCIHECLQENSPFGYKDGRVYVEDKPNLQIDVMLIESKEDLMDSDFVDTGEWI